MNVDYKAMVVKNYNLIKEISWLAFNGRVLEEAADEQVPLLSRIRFLGIFSSNLDEFYRVRVATLSRLTQVSKKAKRLLGQDPKVILQNLQTIVTEQKNRSDQIYSQLLKKLECEQIYIIDETRLLDDQKSIVEQYFREEIRRRLVPIMLSYTSSFPSLRDNSIYLAVSFSSSQKEGELRYSLIEVPQDLPRFFLFPKKGTQQHILLLEDIIRHHLSHIYSIFDPVAITAHTVKLTRDAELDIEDDLDASYMEQIHESLKRRRWGNPVRFVYDELLPANYLEFILRGLKIDPKSETLTPGSRYHNFKDFIDFPACGKKHLDEKREEPLVHPHLGSAKSLIRAVGEQDVLLHFPYHSFHHFIDLLREAAIDAQVQSIKLTVYRVAKHSNIMNALINAAANGKQVTVVLELQARFDEKANIEWADRLKEAGVRVIFGIPGLKVHAKLCLITRRSGSKDEHFAMVGTGNFNENTAKIYTDHMLMTRDLRISEEVALLFEYFEKNYIMLKFRHLIVSPFFTRKRLSRLIEREVRNAKLGHEAWIDLKINNLADEAIIDKLYNASSAGVRQRLIVRGMLSLIPGLPGRSENIEAIRIVDRYLEHSRLVIFANAGQPEVYIASCDWMTRNCDARVEVMCPIFDESLRKELRDYFELQWKDHAKARMADMLNSPRKSGEESQKSLRCQVALYKALKKGD